MNQGKSIYIKCEQINRLSSDISVITLKALTSLNVVAGEVLGKYISLTYYDSNRSIQKRNYTIIRHDGDLLDIAVKHEERGGVSETIGRELSKGSVLYSDGIFGDISVESFANSSNVIMMSGGIGITLPLAIIRALVERQRQTGSAPDVTMVVCVKTFEDIIFMDELVRYACEFAWFDVHYFVSSCTGRNYGNTFVSNRLTIDQLKALVSTAPASALLCGGDNFTSSMQVMVKDCFPECDLVLESFSASSNTESGENAKVFVKGRDNSLVASSGDSILSLLEKYGIALKSRCRAGICGSCRVRILSGDVSGGREPPLSNREIGMGYALACSCYILDDDVEICLEESIIDD